MWNLDPNQIPRILQEVGTSTDEVKWRSSCAPWRARSCATCSTRLDSESVYNSDKRFHKADEAHQVLSKALGPYGVTVMQVILHEHRFAPEYEKVIHDRKLAEQRAEQLKSETESVQQEALRNLETARGKVASDIAKADGNLKQVSLKADAELYAQQQNAEAILAERTANSKAIAKRNEALRGAGGKAMVKFPQDRRGAQRQVDRPRAGRRQRQRVQQDGRQQAHRRVQGRARARRRRAGALTGRSPNRRRLYSAHVVPGMARVTRATLAALVCLALGACSGDPVGAVSNLDGSPSSICGYSPALDHQGHQGVDGGGDAESDAAADGGSDAGTGPCHAARSYVTCTSPSGTGCACVSNDSTCDECPLEADATCQDNCETNEYGLACDPVRTDNGSFTFAPVPFGCRGIDGSFFGNAFYCCPCL